MSIELRLEEAFPMTDNSKPNDHELEVLRRAAALSRRRADSDWITAKQIRDEFVFLSPAVWRRRFAWSRFVALKERQAIHVLRALRNRLLIRLGRRPSAPSLPVARGATPIVKAKHRWTEQLFTGWHEMWEWARRRPGSYQVDDREYDHWSRIFDTPRPEYLARLSSAISALSDPPTFSIVMPTYQADERYFRQALQSVHDQVYPFWKLIVVEDGSGSEVSRRVTREFADKDSRIFYVERASNGGIAEATNTGINEVTSEWLGFMDHDDLLAPHALALVALSLRDHPQWQFCYTDEDKVDDKNRFFYSYFKRDFDPLLLLGQNYMAHFVTCRTEFARQVGPLRTEFNGAQDWDFVLRATEKLQRDQVGHIPHVLYHWRAIEGSTALRSDEKPYAQQAGLGVVQAAIARRQMNATAAITGAVGHVLVHFNEPATLPTVDVVIPTRDGSELETCLASLLDDTDYPAMSVMVIDNGSTQPRTDHVLSKYRSRISVIRDDRPFNYAALHNEHVAGLSGDYLLLMNDDVIARDAEWLRRMVAVANSSDAAIVGAKLLYPNGKVQHDGIVLTPFGPENVNLGEPGWTHRYFGQSLALQEFSAVTAACMLIRRSAWDEVGGFDTRFAVAYNDVDLCLRVREKGYQIVWTPEATLTHYESLSRGSDVNVEVVRERDLEKSLLRSLWYDQLERDPYYNPNLAAGSRTFELAWPPRLSPWSVGVS